MELAETSRDQVCDVSFVDRNMSAVDNDDDRGIPGWPLRSSETPQPIVPSPLMLPTGRAATVIIQLSGLNFITSFNHGLLTIAIPGIALDLHLDEFLYAWPLSVYALSCGSFLLLAGSMADVLGPKKCNLLGSFFLAVFVLASGFSQTGIQLVVFRALQGVAAALAVPSALSIVSTHVKRGQLRNVGFATLGFARDLGFSAGLVLGGKFVVSIGWRAAYYISGSLCFLLMFIGVWALPKDVQTDRQGSGLQRLAKEVDWIGELKKAY